MKASSPCKDLFLLIVKKWIIKAISPCKVLLLLTVNRSVIIVSAQLITITKYFAA